MNQLITEKFRNGFEQKCFQLIIEAYQTSIVEKVIQLNWDENDISSELQRHIKNNPVRFKWKITTNVESHIPTNIPKIKGFASEFSRIDFSFSIFSKYDEYEYFLEAKNLKENDSALKRRYINTGIDNFISTKYTNGSLIGYLLEGNLDETIKGINSFLEKNKRNTEVLKSVRNKLHKNYYEFDHLHIGMLKHLIFDFTALSN